MIVNLQNILKECSDGQRNSVHTESILLIHIICTLKKSVSAYFQNVVIESSQNMPEHQACSSFGLYT